MTTSVVSEVVVTLPRSDRAGGWLATATVKISADEPVLAGHYPGFPIFPGVCVVECVHRGARLTAPDAIGRAVLASLESVRFLAPVLPGDTLTIALDWRGDGPSWWCTGRAATDRGDAAVVRLRYQAGALR